MLPKELIYRLDCGNRVFINICVSKPNTYRLIIATTPSSFTIKRTLKFKANTRDIS